MKAQDSIRWQSWGSEAFEQARRLSKPIFLSITASWCYWCHVLDQESFGHPEVIRRVNADFVPVRVDSDKRPDLNSRYNMGGWPTVAILDDEGRVITGGTYMPTGQLLSMLSSARDGLQKESKSSEEIRSKPSRPPDRVDEAIIMTISRFLGGAFDRDFGGFGGPPKFPQPWAVELALHLYSTTGEKKWIEMATLTLDSMREGTIYDPIDGGFFRYSASNDWDNPHTEKLLDVNAQMLSLYLRAYLLTGQVSYRATAQGILNYLFTTLLAEGQPWFYGSQSADQDYYSQSSLDSGEERIGSDSPALDCTLYTDRNAMAASALLQAYHLLGESRCRDTALEAVHFLWRRGFQKDHGMFHYFEHDKPKLCGYLSDQVYMAIALMDAFEATGSREYLGQAEDLFRVMDLHLWDPESYGYWDLPANPDAQGVLKIRLKPLLENALASISLIRLFYLSGLEVYREHSENILRFLSTIFIPYKHFAAPLAVAVARYLYPPHHLAVVGSRTDPRWDELLRAAHRLKSHWKIILPLDLENDSQALTSLGYPLTHEPRVYPCIGKTCFPPVEKPEELSSLA